MDVVVQTNKATNNKKFIAAIVLIFVLTTSWMMSRPSAANKVLKHEIWSARVEQGDLIVEVSGFGRLKSKTPRLLTTQSNATVDEILLRPGALVTPNSIILKLTSPQISQDVNNTQRALKASKSNYRQRKINQKSAYLAQQATLEILRAELESAELEVEAQSQLIKQGIVSNIQFKRSKLTQRQLDRRLKIEQQRLEQLAALHAENLMIAQEQINEQNEQLVLISQQLEQLSVKAGITGVLQSLAVELGQSVNIGQQLALVGSSTDLMAMLTIAQSQMQQIALAQEVSINTRAGTISGKVNRIDPIVTGGSIQVEVRLTGALTDNARPELNIDGTIFIDTITNALYIDKPVNAQAYQTGRLFRYDSADTASAVDVKFGAATQDKIQVLSGAVTGDRFILSDTSRWQAQNTLTIID